MQHTVLLIDLKRSRRYDQPDREAIQSQLARTCAVLNRLFAPSLERAVDFSAGDELQGLFCTSAGAYSYLRLFRMLLHPIPVRAGLGVGRWDIRMQGGTTAQDGQAYHRARSAIDCAQALGDRDVLCCSGAPEDAILNFALDTECMLTARCTAHQNDLLLLTELLYPVTPLDCIVPEEWSALAGLMREREQIACFARKERPSLFSALAVPPELIEPTIPKPEEGYFTGGKRRGIPTAVAQCAGLSRQSVERTMKTSNLYSARTAALAALSLMQGRKEAE